ncbi:hypothetical protein ANCDUO_13573 [Ancylostoma duodenale]|uniref:Uncharacterized protein n=1 Tax=Ancylostoma duodenale TaxID=51022 RepID=A0A0C2D2I3_9BILA|nr:hypothetical protein ANCDUO_13573 [Ancylostoma duodenale]
MLLVVVASPFVMSGGCEELGAYAIRTAEDLEEKRDELLALTEKERFLVLPSVLSQALPRRNDAKAEKTEVKGRNVAHEASCRDSLRRNERSFES